MAAASTKARKEASTRGNRGSRRATSQARKPAGRKATEQSAARAKKSVAAATARGESAKSDGANGARSVDEQALEGLLEALIAARNGDFSIRLPARRRGIIGELAAAYNELVDTNARMTKEIVRVGRVIGREGRVANAIRTIAKAAATAEGGGRVLVEIVED